MFERPPGYRADLKKQALGRISPGTIRDFDRSLLLTIFLACDIKPGVIFNAGEHVVVSTDQHKIHWKFNMAHSAICRGVFQAGDASPDQLKELTSRMKDFYYEDFIRAGCYFFRCEKGSPVEFEFILLNAHLKHRKSNDGVIYYDVYEPQQEKLASGSFGSIRLITGTLKPQHSVFGDYVFSPGNMKRVSKVQSSSSTYEASIMQRAEMGMVRDICNISNESYFTMRYMRGWGAENFYDLSVPGLFAKENKHKGSIKLVERCMLTQLQTIPSILFFIDGLLSRLQELHKKNIVHCDVKAGNIYLEFDKVSCASEVRLIDTGLSYHLDDFEKVKAKRSAKGQVGTPLYLSPSVVRNKCHTFADDVYAAAITIIIMCDPTAFSRYKSFSHFSADRTTQLYPIFDLFRNKGVDAVIKQQFEEVLRDLTWINEGDRISLQKAKDKFMEITLNYFQLQMSKQHAAKVKDEVERKILIDRDCQRVFKNFHLGCKLRVSLQELANKQATRQNFKKLYKTMLGVAQSLEDHPIALQAFSGALGIAHLMHSKNKSIVESRIDQRYHEYRYAYKKLKQSYSQLLELKKSPNASGINRDQLRSYLMYADRSMLKWKEYHCTFDHMGQVAIYFQEKARKFDLAIKAFLGKNSSQEPALLAAASLIK